MPSPRWAGLDAYRLRSTSGGSTISSTGLGPWINMKRAYSKFALQVRKNSTATSNFSFKLTAALSTASTNPETIITYTQANLNTIVISTAGKPFTCIRWKSTSIVGVTKKLHAFVTAVP
jgi:hypothetical protein